jgi:hypothetical protein
MTEDEQDLVLEALNQIARSDEERRSITSTFYQFICKAGPFLSINPAWALSDSMVDFWCHRTPVNPAFAEYAIRLATIVVNTTASE